MALFLYKDVIKHGFKYVYGIIDDIESGKKISVEVSKGLLKEELFVSTDKNQKLKQLKTKLKTGSDQTILQFLKNNIDVFKTADGAAFLWTKIDKAPYSTGGSGAGTTVTRWAESAVCIALAYKTKNNGENLPLDMDAFNKMDAIVDLGPHDTKRELKLIYDWLKDNDTWFETTIETAKIIYNKKLSGTTKNWNFHRDSAFMKSVYEVFKENLKKLNKIGLRISGDKWNPGDIWISAENEFPTKTDLPSVKKMNAYLLKKYISADIMGISLKKLGKNPTFDTYNLPNQKISFVFNKIVTPKTGTNSKDMYVEAGKNVGDMRIQIRTFDVTGKDNIQCEIKGKNAAGGKAGFGVTSYLIKQLAGVTIKDKDQINRLTEDQKIKEIANGYTKAGFPQYTSAKLKTELTTKEFVDKKTKQFRQEIKDDFFISKIQSTQIAGVLNTLAKKGKADTLITALFSYAHSLGLKEMFDASVYGKVY